MGSWEGKVWERERQGQTKGVGGASHLRCCAASAGRRVSGESNAKATSVPGPRSQVSSSELRVTGKGKVRSGEAEVKAKACVVCCGWWVGRGGHQRQNRRRGSGLPPSLLTKLRRVGGQTGDAEAETGAKAGSGLGGVGQRQEYSIM